MTIRVQAVNEAAPNFRYELRVTRADDGKATMSFFDLNESAAVAKASAAIGRGGWDDATPWAAGTYQMTLLGADWGRTPLAGDPYWNITQTGGENIPGRTGIYLHIGRATGEMSWASRGCLVADLAFLQKIRHEMITDGESANQPVRLVVSNNYDYTFSISADRSNVVETGQVKFTVRINGAGGNGLSKDAWVKVQVENGTSNGPHADIADFDYHAIDNSLVTRKTGGDGFTATDAASRYVYLKAGTTEASFIAKIKQNDDVPNGPDRSERLTLKLVDYYFNNPPKDAPNPSVIGTEYADANNRFLGTSPANFPSTAIAINEILALCSSPLSKSGGVEIFRESRDVQPGSVVNWSYQFYSIPDSIKISDGPTVYVLRSGVSGGSGGSFAIGPNTSGRVTVEVIGSVSGTAWDVSLTCSNNGIQASNLVASASATTLSDAVSLEPMSGPSSTSGGGAATGSWFAQSHSQSIASLPVVYSYVAGVTPGGSGPLHNFGVQPGKSYGLVVRPDSQVAPAMADPVVTIRNSGTSQIFATVNDVGPLTYPVVFFDGIGSGLLDIRVTSALAGLGGGYRINLFELPASSRNMVVINSEYATAEEAAPATDGPSDAALFNVFRLGNISEAASVEWMVSTVSGPSVSAADFAGGVLPSGVVTFAAGQRQAQIAVIGAPDNTLEGREAFTVNLRNPVNVALGPVELTGTGYSAVGVLDDTRSVVARNAVADMNIDGFEDILVQQASTGTLYYAALNETGFWQWFPAVGNLTPAWRAVGAGNFDTDVSSEILMRNIQTHQVFIADFNFFGFSGWRTATPNVTGEFQIRSIGDMDNNGFDDIVFQNVANGSIFVAFQGAASFQRWGLINNNITSAWTAVGIGDFDANGSLDIAIQDGGTGNIFYARVEGQAFAGWGILTTNITAAWRMVGAGDVDGDGDADFFLRGPSAELYLGIVHGGRLAEWRSLVTALPAPNRYEYPSVGDYDGDSFADIILRDTQTGDALYLDINNGYAQGWRTAVPNVTPDWGVV